MKPNYNNEFANWYLALGYEIAVNHWRGDCFKCGGKNTLSISNKDGTLFYNCFRASCDLQGAYSKGLSTEDIKTRLQPKVDIPKKFEIPEHFVDVRYRPEAIAYLWTNHCIDAFRKKLVDIRYDPKQNRVVFMVWRNGECYGAVGRSLNRTVLPKWYVYGNPVFFGIYLLPIRPNSQFRRRGMVALVEDCASACSVSSVCPAISLLGTSLPDAVILEIGKYDTIFICLDKDASKKAIDMQRRLSYYVANATVRLLEQDLKYCKKEEIERILYGQQENSIQIKDRAIPEYIQQETHT